MYESTQGGRGDWASVSNSLSLRLRRDHLLEDALEYISHVRSNLIDAVTNFVTYSSPSSITVKYVLNLKEKTGLDQGSTGGSLLHWPTPLK